MRKIFLTLIALSAFFGLSIAQEPESHWPDINIYAFEDHDPFVVMMSLDNSLITPDDNYANYEVAAFVGEDDYRGHGFMKHYAQFDDPNPILEFEIFYKPVGNTNEGPLPVYFKLYDHNDGSLYDLWTCSVEIVTQTQYNSYIFSEMPVLSFFSPITKEIQSYTESESSNGGYYLIASPIGQVKPSEVGEMLNNKYDLYQFNQSAIDEEWENYKKEGEHYQFDLVPGKGYLYANSENVTLSFHGLAYEGNGEVTLTYDGNAKEACRGVNLIGNPYATDATLDMPFYRLNSDGSALNTETEQTTIKAMDGVIVKVDANTTATFTQVTTKGNAKTIAKINLMVTSNRGTIDDNAIIRFDNGATLGKYQLFESNSQVYIPQNGKNYAIVNAENEGELPVNFKAAKNGTYTLSFNTENVTVDYLHLIDKFTGNDVDLLATPSYSFDANTNDYASRFRLVFATTDNTDNQFAFISNGQIILNGINGYTTVQLFDVTGRMLSSTNGTNCISTENMANGVYMIRLINGSDVKTQKIVVK